MYTEGQMASSSKKLIITSIDETFVYDCQGNEVMHFTENTQRSKSNKVEIYEIEDGEGNELGTTRFYYNFGGDLQIHAPNGRILGKGSSPFAFFYSDWIFTIKPEFYAKEEGTAGISADGIYPTLLWMSEEDNTHLGLGPVFGILISCFVWLSICICVVICQIAMRC